jgi:hypothetical protein
MTVVEGFLLGMIVAWTPSLVLLAWMLWRNPTSEHVLRDVQH